MADNALIDPNLLPFSPDKQKGVLGYTLYDERFFAVTISKIEAEWFADPIACRIFDVVKKWWIKWKTQISISDLLDSRDILKLSASEINQVRGLVTSCSGLREKYAVAPLLEELEIWCKARVIQVNLPKAAIAFNGQKLTNSIDIMNKMVKEYHEIQFHASNEIKFLDYGSKLAQQEADLSKALTFGVTAMDRLIEPNGTAGCLLPGHMTLLLAPTNVGKTSTMVTVACANIKAGKSVLFLFHEGTEDELQNKFMRCMAGMNNPEMLRGYVDPPQAEGLRHIELLLSRFLTLKPIFKAGLTVEEVASEVEVLQDSRRMLTGHGYDLLVDDYPAKLTCIGNSRGNMAPRQVQEEVYNQFVQLGLRHQFHVLVAIQTNRDGSRVNARQGPQANETRLIQKEDVMEAWGPITAAATVVSLNRSDEDAEMGIITFALCKSRSGETGWAVVCKTDYGRCRVHSNDMGSFWYRGQERLGRRCPEIMLGYKNQLVSKDKIQLYEQLG